MFLFSFFIFLFANYILLFVLFVCLWGVLAVFFNCCCFVLFFGWVFFSFFCGRGGGLGGLGVDGGRDIQFTHTGTRITDHV